MRPGLGPRPAAEVGAGGASDGQTLEELTIPGDRERGSSLTTTA